MKNVKYPLLSIAILAIFISLFSAAAPEAKAATMEELQAQIANLLKQIAQLQAQIGQSESKQVEWCYDFNANLRIGDAGTAVCSLKTALQKEGFEAEVEKTEEGSCKFSEEMASAISGFQQKYADEILKPLDLKYGTGFLGKSTRAKLNKLFGCGVKAATSVSTIPVPVCNIFLTCEGGYTSYNTGEKDSQGCPIIKCVSSSVPAAQSSVSTISEQVKCVFYNSNSKQECYSSAGSSCAGNESCTADVKGKKGEQITWKSSCGGYVYTTIDNQNEYAEFKCVLAPTTTQYITLISPNGGETWAKGSTQILQWKSSPDINMVYIKLRKGSDTYPGTEGAIGGVGNAGTNPGSHQWTIPTTLPDGNDYAIRIVDEKGAVYDDSDAPFSIVTTLSQNNSPKIVGVPAIPEGIQAGQSVNFSWSSQDEDNDDLVWRVSWGDGIEGWTTCPTNNLSNGQGWKYSPSHFWAAAGIYTVKTTVSDCKGGTSSQSFTVNVGVATAVPTTPVSSVTPTLTVIFPNGGETWYMGKTYDILWKSSGVEKVYIAAKVFKDGVSVGSLGIASSLDNVSAASGKYSWTPNSNHLLEGNQIKIEISNTEIPVSGISTPETLPSDESDNYFKIISSGTGLKDVEDMLASVSQAISQLGEGIKELIGR